MARSDRQDASTGDERLEALRVLIVDDNPEIRFLFEIGLSHEPAVRLVGQAEDGQQALEKVELLGPDLVVMDLQMPVLDGVSSTRRIKEAWPIVEVVGYTSEGDPASHDAMRAAGAAECFDKAKFKQVLDFIRNRAGALAARPPKSALQRARVSSTSANSWVASKGLAR